MGNGEGKNRLSSRCVFFLSGYVRVYSALARRELLAPSDIACMRHFKSSGFKSMAHRGVKQS